MGQKLEMIEKFLGMRNPEGGGHVMRALERKEFLAHLNI